MQLVLIYALGAALAAGMAYFSGSGTPALVFGFYVAGAALFGLAAIGQFFKLSKPRR